MDAIVAHFQDHLIAYIVVAACALPVLFVYRKYVVPIFAYALEVCIYMGLLHSVLFLVVKIIRWFKMESSFEAIGAKTDPGWGIPWMHFWKHDLFNPHWLVYLELAFMVIFVYFVWKLRPMRIQKIRERGAARKPGAGKSGVRPPAKGAFAKKKLGAKKR